MGKVVISLDAELAWGFHDLETLPTDQISQARDAWCDLLEWFDQYEIPATWAVVGHLFLDRCDGVHDDHASLPGWFERDPGGTVAKHPEWFGPKLVAAIQAADVDHEIGSHTFSHVECGNEQTSADVVRAELEASRQLAAKRGLEMDSLVFPRNNVGHRSVIAETGFSCYRGRQPMGWYAGTPAYAPVKYTQTLFGRTPPLVEPEIDEHGLVNVPASLYLFTYDQPLGPATDAVLGDVIVRRACRGIDAAETSDGVFHMWLHPNNLTRKAERERVRRVLEYLAESPVSVWTMGQVAEDMGVVA